MLNSGSNFLKKRILIRPLEKTVAGSDLPKPIVTGYDNDLINYSFLLPVVSAANLMIQSFLLGARLESLREVHRYSSACPGCAPTHTHSLSVLHTHTHTPMSFGRDTNPKLCSQYNVSSNFRA